MSNLLPRSPAFYTVFTNLQETLQKVSFLKRNICGYPLSCRPEGRKKGMLPLGRASLRASPFIRKYQRLVLDYGVPIAVLYNRAALAQNDLAGAGGGFSGIVLIEGTAVDGDVSGGAILAVQLHSGVAHLKVLPLMMICALSSA